MAEQKSIFGTMPKPDIDEADAQGAFQRMMRSAAQESTPDLDMLARLQKRRAERMNVAAKALTKELGKDHPDVIALKEGAVSAAAIHAEIGVQTARFKRWPKPRADEWAVFGTVLDSKNKPVAGANVRVFDRDRKYDDLLGEAETDKNGDFSVVYRERDFMEHGEKNPDLYVMVSDAMGKQLYSSRDHVRFEAGKSEYFAIQIGKQSAPVRKKTKRSATKKPPSTPKQ